MKETFALDVGVFVPTGEGPLQGPYLNKGGQVL